MAKTSGNKGRNRKVVSYQKKKKRKFDWFFLVFAAILVYLVVQVMHFADNDDIALFEVKTSEKISTNRYYSGLITREEYVYTADHAGYINFYVTNGRKASAGATIYTLDETGNFSQLLIAASNDGTDLARDSLLRLKDKMVEFSTEFQPIDFKDVYTVKNTIVVSVLDALNEEALQQLADSASQDAFFKVSTDQSGFVLYQSDQYDGADNDTLQVSDLIQHVAETKITQAGSYVEQDAFVYKLVKDDQFSVHFLLSEDEMNRFGKNLSYTEGTRQSVYFEQLEQTLQGKMYLELLGDGTVCARIDFTSMGSNFLNNRFVEFELVDENMIGLKIPSCAVTEKQFFMVPAAYQSVNNSGRVVFFKEAVDSEGNPSVQNVIVQIYGVVTEDTPSEDGSAQAVDKWYYIDAESLQLGDVLRSPDGGETYTISNQVTLPGVYLANQGYAEFRQISILGETSDHNYQIVEKGVRYGISPFDYIVVDAASVEEYQVLYY